MSFWSNVSVVMIVLDAEDVLSEALDSLPPEAERVIADGGSRDRTVDIARERGALVVRQQEETIAAAGGNFDVARNAAAEQASRDWLFFLDADERLTPELVNAVAALNAADAEYAAYDMPRINLYWGKPVRLLGADHQIRLVRKGRGRYAATALHHAMEVEGTVGRLDAPLLHLNVRGWKDVTRRFRREISVQARPLHPVPTRRAACGMLFHLFRHYYIRNEAWRDGWRGAVMSAVYAAYGSAAAWTARRRSDA